MYSFLFKLKSSFNLISAPSINLLIKFADSLKVNEDYIEDFLDLYGKYIGLLIPQIKALYETVKIFQEEAEDVIQKYV